MLQKNKVLRSTLFSSKIAINENILSAGKTIVHEWAHLRWGLFDEFNGPDGPHFYLHNGQLKPVSCVENLEGRSAHKDHNGKCLVDPNTLKVLRQLPAITFSFVTVSYALCSRLRTTADSFRRYRIQPKLQ